LAASQTKRASELSASASLPGEGERLARLGLNQLLHPYIPGPERFCSSVVEELHQYRRAD